MLYICIIKKVNSHSAHNLQFPINCGNMVCLSANMLPSLVANPPAKLKFINLYRISSPIKMNIRVLIKDFICCQMPKHITLNDTARRYD